MSIYSEMIMYEAQLLRESEQLQEAINHLDQFEAHVCYSLAVQEFKGLCVCVHMSVHVLMHCVCVISLNVYVLYKLFLLFS